MTNTSQKKTKIYEDAHLKLNEYIGNKERTRDIDGKFDSEGPYSTVVLRVPDFLHGFFNSNLVAKCMLDTLDRLWKIVESNYTIDFIKKTTLLNDEDSARLYFFFQSNFWRKRKGLS